MFCQSITYVINAYIEFDLKGLVLISKGFLLCGRRTSHGVPDEIIGETQQLITWFSCGTENYDQTPKAIWGRCLRGDREKNVCPKPHDGQMLHLQTPLSLEVIQGGEGVATDLLFQESLPWAERRTQNPP